MMSGRFIEYNWRDIERLLYADAGVKTDGDARTKGQMWFVNRFGPPEHVKDTIIRVQVYDKDFSTRIEEHCKD